MALSLTNHKVNITARNLKWVKNKINSHECLSQYGFLKKGNMVILDIW